MSCDNTQRVADTLAMLVGGLLEELAEPHVDEFEDAEQVNDISSD